MEEKKTSIIVPVYKVEKYMEQCIGSLLAQTYKNLEIILVDDESPDRCPQICDAYAAADKRIKVIHKKNGGAASARNAGLDIASGDYISFVDSDDYADPEYIKKLVLLLEQTGADIVACSYINVYTEKQVKMNFERTGAYTGKGFLERFLWDWTCGLIWNKLFKKQTLLDVRFKEGHLIDDEFFTYQAVLNAQKVYIMNEHLYYYRLRKSGVMGQKRNRQKLLDRMEYFPERFSKVTGKYPELYPVYLENLTDNLIRFRREALQDSALERKLKEIQRGFSLKILFGPVSLKLKYSYLRSLADKKRYRGLTVEPEEQSGFFD